MFKYLFCKNYYSKHQIWPNCHFRKPDSLLKKHYEQRSWPSKGEMRKLTYKAFKEIEFEKTLDFDFNDVTPELLKDSALAPLRKHWYTAFDNCAFVKLYGKRKPYCNEYDEKRVLMKYLKTESDQETRKKILDTMNGHFRFGEDDISVLCGKNQELKTGGGRNFVKQTMNQRLEQTCMEDNLSKHILKYLPDQTMTNTELEVLKRMTSAVYNLRNREDIINMDFSKWNLAFRQGLVGPFGHVIDCLFGLPGPLYATTHLWFTNATVFTNSRLHPPDIGPYKLQRLSN